MTQGWRKLVLGTECVIGVVLTALITRDSVLTGVVASGLSVIMGTVMYGYKAEYKSKETKNP